MYEILFNHTIQVVLIRTDRAAGAAAEPIFLDPQTCLGQVGFEPGGGASPLSWPVVSGLSPPDASSSHFQASFCFSISRGWREPARAGFAKQFEVVLFMNRGSEQLEQDVNADTFQLGCTPAINLFEQTAEPIALDQTRYEYRVVPDVANQDGMEVYSIDQVTGVDPISGRTTDYQPFYSFRHGVQFEDQKSFWYAVRRPSLQPADRGTDVYLNLVDLGFDPRLPTESTLVVRTTCTNRELPMVLQKAGERLALELEAAAPLSQIRCLRSPSSPQRPPFRRGLYWRLVSHLSLNHLSMSHGTEGRDALQEILRLYDFSDPEVDKRPRW